MTKTFVLMLFVFFVTGRPFKKWTHKLFCKPRKSLEQYELAWSIFNSQMIKSSTLLLENFIFLLQVLRKLYILHF